MVKPPMDARDAPRRPTAGSVPLAKPRRVIIGDDPKKRPSMFTQFKLGTYEAGPSLAGLSAVIIPIMAIILGLLSFAIFHDNKRHHLPLSLPPICVRGYEI